MKKFKKILLIIVYLFLIILIIGTFHSVWFFQHVGTQTSNGPNYPLGEFERRAIAKVSDLNGINSYLKATLAYDSISFLGKRGDSPENRPIKLLDKVLKEGWNQDYPQLNIVLEKNKKALDLIKECSKKGYATLPKIEKPSYSMPFPNTEAFHHLGKLLIAEGYKYQFQKDYSHAVEDWLIAIQFAQSYGGENSWLIGKLVSMSIESHGYSALEKFLKENPNQSDKFYADLIERLGNIRRNEKSTKYAFGMEFQMLHDALEKSPRNLRSLKALTGISGKRWAGWYFLFRKGTVLKNMDNFHKEYLGLLDDIDWRTYQTELEKMVIKLDPVNKLMVPGFLSLPIRHLVLNSQAGIIELMAGIQYFKVKNHKLPDSIEELRQDKMKEMPKDPFTEKPFVYLKMDKDFKLYSSGPDSVDDKGELVYDPTNGTISAGDIVY